jgi:hypothetical protein
MRTSLRVAVLVSCLVLSACSGLVACGASGSGGSGGGGSGGTIQTCSLFMNPNPCPDSCVGGYCMTKTSTTCHLSNGSDDGCDVNSICREPGVCYVAPACPANGICPAPANEYGDVTCNTGALPGKASICIPDRCLADADCHFDHPCVREKTTDVLGICYQGQHSVESDGAGTAWDSAGCEMKPTLLVGKAPAGSSCTDPVECAPTCCSCAGGNSALLAAKCTYGSGLPLKGMCAPAAEACASVMQGGSTDVCTAP